jgi:hypothetical protein
MALALEVTLRCGRKDMLLTLQDDGVLRVYRSVDDAVRDVEALDAEDVFRAVFDETGEVYSIHWIRPNGRGQVFRFLVSNGTYTLVPKNLKDIPALLKVIREAHAVEPEDARDRLQELERRLTT